MSLDLVLLAAASFVQNMAFTWMSRARNGSSLRDVWCAGVVSNLVFFVIQVFLMRSIWGALTTGELEHVALTGAVYVVFTSWGSAHMFSILIRRGK